MCVKVFFLHADNPDLISVTTHGSTNTARVIPEHREPWVLLWGAAPSSKKPKISSTAGQIQIQYQFSCLLFSLLWNNFPPVYDFYTSEALKELLVFIENFLWGNF